MTKPTYAQQIASELEVKAGRVQAAIDLLDAGNTLPFIARYRKEKTGGLDEEQIRTIQGSLTSLRTLDERRESVLASIQEQGQLTPDLEDRIRTAETLTAVEDLYQPYRRKRRTRRMARERGLQPLADEILAQSRSVATAEEVAALHLRQHPDNDIASIDEALTGARDIVAEVVTDHPDVRRITREKTMRFGIAGSTKVKGATDEREVYRAYYDFQLRVERIRPHQVLALNRGEAQKVLRVSIETPERDWRGAIATYFRPNPRSPLSEQLALAIDDGAKRLLLPAIERDVRRDLTAHAESHAIQVFAQNLRSLLSQPPFVGHTILAIDPGYRTGCKVAVVDSTGRVLDTNTIYPHSPQRQTDRSLAAIGQLVERHEVTIIVIGNGTASRESEELIAEYIRNNPAKELSYLIVDEAGASVYSASKLARAELLELDVSLRSAVSIARRVQDPLAELVKIDPQSIGVGMYQHDVDQTALSTTLDGVVESVVNQVGVDLNTASPALLTHVSGIGPKLAERVVDFRDAHGQFNVRRDLLQVAGLGPKSFEQAAGFLRIRDGANPLDETAIHPESYDAAIALMDELGLDANSSAEQREARVETLRKSKREMELADRLGIGLPTLQDILEQLVRPGRDPREDLPVPILRSDVLTMDDLSPGLRLEGTVRNVVDFGAFVDVGVKQDGLLHRSQIPQGAVLQVGDILSVEVRNVEVERGRISLGWAG